MWREWNSIYFLKPVSSPNQEVRTLEEKKMTYEYTYEQECKHSKENISKSHIAPLKKDSLCYVYWKNEWSV